MVRTEKNNVVESGKKHFSENKSSGDYSYPEWSKAVIPQLHPIISDYRYLEEQHLLLAIKSVDNDESYGECCIALRTMVNVIPQECDGIILSHHGEETGEIMIEMHVKLPDNNNMKTSSQSDDLISTDDLEMTRKGSVKMPQVPQRRSHVPQGTAKRADENPPVIPKRHSTTQPDTMSGDPPPLPAKKSKPKTVGEIMERIGFPQYTSSLLEYGWDDLEFLSDLTEGDLTEAGVPKEHQRMVRLGTTQFSATCTRMCC
ncbi:phosphatidylinositol 3,4,5-trisphosphate 5-phosphatase 2-like isoform X2 [Orbicella faveolata]|uniref:phosphatidylinositol 3,4,5-trisphosphate 5-phosphatase 2-like isoform X2 n=1 Tax=Orbicella faveolata TaxID=48498 RepID=UPI0009E1D51C|nr:phosphatidylinositol 3,4,5-trisphosphate 5-phosphatase 2-like isoform X2 [Orbicella faveolata]